MNENKKQYLYTITMVLLALVVGIAAMFCIKKYDVHAEETSNNILLGSCDNVMNQTVFWYAPGKHYSFCAYQLTVGTKDYVILARGDAFGGVASFDTYADIIAPSGTSTNKGKFVLNTDKGYYAADGFYLSSKSLKLYVPKFSSQEKAVQYARGEIDVTEADNYEDIKDVLDKENSLYDASVPIPDDVSISACSSNGVQAVWTYSDSSNLNYNGYSLQYDVSMEYLYSSMSATSGALFGYTGSSSIQGVNIDTAIGKLQTVEAKHTVEEYLLQGEPLVNDLLKSGIVEGTSGNMSPINSYTGTPPDYTSQFVSSGNPFFSGATNSTHAIFIGSQVTVTPYYIDSDGIRHYGKDSITRKFINGITSIVAGGSSTVIVATDGEGNKYYESDYVPSYDSSGSLANLDNNNITKYISDGFGLLGDNGFLALTQKAFGFIPSAGWVLIFLAMAVSISLILFKVLRGM